MAIAAAVAVIATGSVALSSTSPVEKAAAATSSTCTSSFYWVQSNQLYVGSPLNVPFGTAVGAAATTSYNAMGYNSQDGYLYALTNSDLVKIDPSTGVVTTLGTVTGLPTATNYDSGTFDDSGHLWVSNNQIASLYEIDVSKVAVANTLTPTTGSSLLDADIVWWQGDILRVARNLGSGVPAKVYFIDTTTGDWTVTTSAGVASGSLNGGLSMWLGSDGRLFIATTTGAVNELVNWQSDGWTVTKIAGNGTVNQYGDGANCVAAKSPFTIAASDDDYTASPVLVADGGTVGNVWTNDTVEGVAPSTTNTAVTVTADGGATGVTIGTDGSLTVPAGLTAGTYSVSYQICETDAPTVCSTAVATFALVDVLPTATPTPTPTPTASVTSTPAPTSTITPDPADTSSPTSTATAAAASPTTTSTPSATPSAATDAVATSATGTLAYTGIDFTWPGIIMVVLTVFGMAMILIGMRRKQKAIEAANSGEQI